MRDYKLRKKVFNDYATKEDLENAGGGGGALVCHLLESTNALDHTWNEINSAMRAGKNVVVIYDVTGEGSSVYPVVQVGGADNEYVVALYEMEMLIANSPDGYPTFGVT